MTSKITYAVRVICDQSTGYIDINAVRKYWCGQILIRENSLERQIYDMVPPADFPAEETKKWAEQMVKFVQDELGYKAEVVEAVSLN